MPEGWLTDHERYWSMHFHRDCRSWVRDPLVFVDLGRAMADGSPALLKRRQHLPLSEAQALWRSLESSGWRQTAPVWGEDAVPMASLVQSRSQVISKALETARRNPSVITRAAMPNRVSVFNVASPRV